MEFFCSRKHSLFKADLPPYIEDKYHPLFAARAEFSVPELFVKEYKNVFVSHEGLCLQNGRLLPFSSFNICTRYDNSFGIKYYKLVWEQYLVSTYGKSLKKIPVDAATLYTIIHTKWFNYSFWITSSLSRLLMACDTGKAFVLIYPEGWDAQPYIRQSLQAFPGIKTLRISDGIHVSVPRLLLPEVRPFTACFNGEYLKKTADHLISHIPENLKSRDFPSRIYLTRSNAKYRKVVNESALVEVLDNYGFTVVDFDILDFWQQVAYMHHAECFVSAHGAGMANIMFMKPHARVFELTPIPDDPKDFHCPYWIMAEALGLDYNIAFCESVNKEIANVYLRDILVDIKSFQKICKRIFK